MQRIHSFRLIIISIAMITCLAYFQPDPVEYFSLPLESPTGNAYGQFGYSVSGAGDVNSDGYDDVVIGEPGASRVYIFSIYDSTMLDTLAGPQGIGNFGFSVAGIGDVNNDDHDDVLVGIDWGGSPGRAWVYDGATGDTLYSVGSSFPLIGGAFGRAVSSAGDVNNDGTPDLLIGAPEEFPGGVNRGGRAYIFNGLNGDTLHNLVSPNTVSGGFFGQTVAALGDINNDGHDDVLVGAPDEIRDSQRYGNVYVFSGASGDTLLSLYSPNPTPFGSFGAAIAGAGDVNNDSIPDIVVGSFESAGDVSTSGRVYVFSGADGGLIHTISSPNITSFGYFGVAVSGYTDVDNDNHDDFLIGAYHEASFEDVFLAGRVYLYSGQSGDTLRSLESPNPEEAGKFGFDLATAGDVNNDGGEDFIVGAHGEIGGEPQGEGRAYIFSANPFIVSGLPRAAPSGPSEFTLENNYPNPFNPSTRIPYTVGRRQHVTLRIYDTSGRRIAILLDEVQEAGRHEVRWNGRNRAGQLVASGVYYYRLTSDAGISQSKKLMLLR